MDREQWIAEAMRLVNEFGQMRESAGGSAAVFAREAANAERQQADETAHQIFAHLRTLPDPAAGVSYTDEPWQDALLAKFKAAGFAYDGNGGWRADLTTAELLVLGQAFAYPVPPAAPGAASPDLAPPYEGEPDAILKRGRYAVGGTYWDVLVLNQDLPDGTPLYAHPAPAQGERDAKRFAWYFSDKPKGDWLATYLDGVRAGWTIDEWRAAIDAAMSSEGSKKP